MIPISFATGIAWSKETPLPTPEPVDDDDDDDDDDEDDEDDDAMSNNVALAGGAILTTLNGKRCTAVPKPGANLNSNNNNNNNNNNNGNSGQAQATLTTARASANIQTEAASVAVETTASSTTSSSLVLITTTSSSSSSTSSTTSISLALSLESLASAASVTFQANAGLLAPAAQATSAEASTSSSSSLSSSSSQPINPPPAAPSSSGSQASQADDPNNTATLATVATGAAAPSSSQEALDATVTPPPSTDAGAAAAPTAGDGAGTAALFTTIGTDAAAAASTDGATSNPAVSAVESPSSKAESTIAVAGGVIGGVALISLVAFLVWFWRRRTMRKRRSTLLTPLDAANLGRGGAAGGAGYGGEKGEYEINRGSIGPTPRSERIKASFDYSMRRVRARFSQLVGGKGSIGGASAVNMNRGNSQFMEADALSRRPTNASMMTKRGPGGGGSGGGGASAKDRFADWWGRVTADALFTWRLKSGKVKDVGGIGSSSDPFAAAREKKAAAADLGRSPDFLTLLGMDERELDQEAKRKNNGGGGGGRKLRKAGGPRSSSVGSESSFLGRGSGGLDLDFSNDDPFSDANALAHQSAKPAPLIVSQADNPFSDANAIRPKPSTYVADIRRSRGQSVDQGGAGAGVGVGIAGGAAVRQSNFRGDSVYRESALSVDTFATRRNNKFRSDPFDLEPLRGAAQQQRATSSNMSTAGSSMPPRLSDVPSSGGASSGRLSGGVGTGDIRRPRAAHQRSESFSSKYSSGISMGDWSDPGPDVGPAAARWGADSPTRGRVSRSSGGSDGSVGKAL